MVDGGRVNLEQGAERLDTRDEIIGRLGFYTEEERYGHPKRLLETLYLTDDVRRNWRVKMAR
jgi:hypothetical protein